MRECATCGRRYLRRNLVEVWTVRNVGHRAGWVKQKVRQCLACQPIPQSQQLLRVIRVRAVVTALRRRAVGR